jgi:ABC-2 type transport system ATP-binding protein
MIRINDLKKNYGNVQALQSINLELNSGEILGLVGANGAGKSTLIKCLVGLVRPDSGTILRQGRAFSWTDKKDLGYAAESPLLYDYLTGQEFLRFVGEIRNMDNRLLSRRIDYYLELFCLHEKSTELIADYSHGMRQKISLAAALLSEPAILLVDEPTNGLDPESVFNLKNELQRLCRQGTAVLFSSHMLDTVEKICRRVAVLHHGRLLADDQLERLVAGAGHLEEAYMAMIRSDRDDNTPGVKFP